MKDKRITDLEDKVDALESELTSAVEVAYRHGAKEWVRLNYPKAYARLEEKHKE